MRPRSEGTQASGAGASHTQEANVAEVSHGEDGYSRTQVSRQLDCHPVVSVSEGSEAAPEKFESKRFCSNHEEQ